MKELKKNNKKLQKVCYIAGVIIIVATLVFGLVTIGKDLLDAAISSEKRSLLVALATGIVLVLEGKLLTDVEKDKERLLLLLFLGVISTIGIIVNTIWSGIGQFFSFYGLVDLVFCLINIFILVNILKVKEKIKK